MNFLKSIFSKNEGEGEGDKRGGKETNEREELTCKSFLNMQKDNFHECVICLEEMKTGEELTVIRCSHIYHSHCIQTWANKKRICPLCDCSF